MGDFRNTGLNGLRRPSFVDRQEAGFRSPASSRRICPSRRFYRSDPASADRTEEKRSQRPAACLVPPFCGSGTPQPHPQLREQSSLPKPEFLAPAYLVGTGPRPWASSLARARRRAVQTAREHPCARLQAVIRPKMRAPQGKVTRRFPT